MIIKAKFKGPDGSRGYQNGRNYKLNFIANSSIFVTSTDKTDSTATYGYTTVRAFLNHWQIFSDRKDNTTNPIQKDDYTQ